MIIHAWWALGPSFHTSIHPCICYCLQYLKQGRYAYPLVTLQMTEHGSSPFCNVHTQFAACILQYKTKFQIIFYADEFMIINLSSFHTGSTLMMPSVDEGNISIEYDKLYKHCSFWYHVDLLILDKPIHCWYWEGEWGSENPRNNMKIEKCKKTNG